MRLRFRTRLTIWYVAVLGVLLSLTAAGLLYALGRIAENKFDAALWMVGAAEAESAVASLRQRGVERPDDLTVSNTRYRQLLGYDRGPLEKFVTVVDDNGRVADMTGNLAEPLPVDGRLLARAYAGETVYKTVQVAGLGRLRLVYMPVRGESVPHPFVVVVGLPESFVGGEMESFRAMIALASVTLLLLTGASAMLLAERAIKPVEEVAAAAETVTAQNLDARIPAAATDDQIGRLVSVFNQMLERLAAAFEAQRRFTSRAAHELRTPLTILKGETQVALNRTRSVEEYVALLKSNLEEVDKLVVMIDDLLSLARYESGEAGPPREKVDLSEVARDVVEALRPLARRKEIELVAEVEDLHVDGDLSALRRLVCNLVENAIFYTPSGGRVAVGLRRVEGRAEFVVEDSGIGIAPEDLSNIFERFFRSGAAREMRPEGSGIGLAVCAAIARLHRATINVASEKGSGTRFVVSFPPGVARSWAAEALDGS